MTERVENVPSSDHNSSTRGNTRDRSRSKSNSRGRGIFSNMPRPPASSFMTKSLSGKETNVKPEVEMVKIQIDVHKQIKHDDTSSLDMHGDGGRKQDVTFV